MTPRLAIQQGGPVGGWIFGIETEYGIFVQGRAAAPAPTVVQPIAPRRPQEIRRA
jgi:hypothetical protein